MSKSAELKGMSFDEIASPHGTEAAIDAGIAGDPEWGQEELDMSDARPVTEALPDLVEHYRRTRGKQKTPQDSNDNPAGHRSGRPLPRGRQRLADKAQRHTARAVFGE